MARMLRIGAVRMDAAPDGRAARLSRAASLVARAAQAGAQLVVLPELFNSGYAYTPDLYTRAEALDGVTVSWMRDMAQRYGVHLAGSLLLREEGDLFNALLLVAPDGMLWRYDKSYPWVWERAYFRPRRHALAVAETALGRVGLLICWDVAHTALWAAYAGQVDVMVSSSCPPLMHQMRLHAPDGRSVAVQDLGPLFRLIYRHAEHTFEAFYLRQVRWMGVPAVNTTGAGVFRSPLPRPVLSAMVLLALRPDWWKELKHARALVASAGYFDATFVADATGLVLARVAEDGDGVAVASVALAERPPLPQGPQPRYGLHPMGYGVDALVNVLMRREYERRKG